ncbi:C40 family peptidase [uncultured Chitinophaga sp.]|uniref:C40 family peptidase n=1 Tax=uncultured Chitinophaga sp. TaxID=339340 RepID=UPI0025EF3303|nr:C40 family peptidase [uncultured Chitinophaga sp.]
MKISKGKIYLQLPLSLLLFASCSSVKKSASSTAKARTVKEQKSSGSGKVEFIDDIAISRGTKTTEHRYEGRNNSRGESRRDHRSGADIENARSWQFKYAQLLDVAVEEVRDEKLFGFIEEWWGTPYRLGGNTRTGIDCSHFATTLLTQVYQMAVTGNSADLYNQVQKLNKRKDLQYGDLVFFKINRKNISHVGVYLENDRFVHASVSSGVMISDLNEDYWRRYYVGAGRIN